MWQRFATIRAQDQLLGLRGMYTMALHLLILADFAKICATSECLGQDVVHNALSHWR